ncbi:hypothetical protein NI392_07720 [Vibrio alginolyticus]|nr:hypothetical protein NI392_07720 [Vibrio alginolyticus]
MAYSVVKTIQFASAKSSYLLNASDVEGDALS